MPTQINNDELMGLTETHFQGRNEPQFAWQNLLSMLSTAPGLRGLWMMNAFDGDGDCLDCSGNGLTLSNNGDIDYDLEGLIPNVDLDGAGDYLNRADQAEFDVTGTETYVQAAMQGSTIVSWVKPDAGNIGGAIVSHWQDNINERGYLINIDATGYHLYLSLNGIATSTIGSGVAYTAGVWTFLCTRFDPGASLRLRVDETEYTNLVAPASIHPAAAPFYIGRRDTGAAQVDYDGLIGPTGLYATYWPDHLVETVWAHSRSMFGI